MYGIQDCGQCDKLLAQHLQACYKITKERNYICIVHIPVGGDN